ncbi:MAG TPA: zf-TFIIB domain-containing protein [Thermoanaerobaculia bacterium]|jgi:Zn-finger nucleic acid-binding protein|nr:zf-TFIIB domain-containing protein [Thermoanaerobaculia bacterium]
MRHLVVCSRCRRQLDAGDRGPGEQVRCPCGELVEVPALAAHDSAVVRCSACGAPREGSEPDCRYCGSSFTVHDRDIDTICPVCMARVSGGARFCDHCGSPILVEQAAAAATPLHCPVCGPARQLTSRQLGGEPVAVSECETCGGLWVDRSTFEVLVVRARHSQLGSAALALAVAAATAGPRPGAPGGGRIYRPCAVCGALMNRQNYGRMSGVILDICRAHGIWFDLDELPRVLSWIQNGGEQRADRLGAEQAQAAARQRRLDAAAAGSGPALGGGWGYREPDGSLFAVLVNLLGDGLSYLFDRR